MSRASFGEVAGPRNHDSKGGEKKMMKVSVHYPNHDGSTFDMGR